MIPRPLSMAVAALALAVAPGLAKADLVNFSGGTTGVADPVKFTGSISVTPGGATSATIQITINNTTSTGDAVQYGYITGFGFNVPGTTTATGTSTDPDFKFLTAVANTTSLQAGEFTYAFSTNANQLHTVATSEISKGLAAGQSATFTVTVNGANAGSLTAAAIMAATAPANAPFSVRFRSTNTTLYPGGNSPDGDKVPVSTWAVVPPPPTGAVPAPAGLVLGLIGAGCFLGRNLRRKVVAAK
ncbi:MAG: hypothetical protein U0791_10410 [Gemmataceae bacterium]